MKGNQENGLYPRRININLALDAALEEHVRGTNRAVVKFGFDDICFDSPKLHIPHATLLMGVIQSEEDLGTLVNLCAAFSTTVNRLSYTVSPPHWNRPGGSYLFLSTLPDERFAQLRFDLYRLLNTLLDYDEFGGPEDESHITVAYASSTKLELSMLPLGGHHALCVSSKVRVCDTGLRGACTSTLWSGELGNAG
jgi:hypothetical protein